MREGAVIKSTTLGQGNAGAITINASGIISIDGSVDAPDGSNSNISSQVGTTGIGNAGAINITTGSLEIIEGGEIDASISSFGQGNAGEITITANDTISLSNNALIFSRINGLSRGNSGGINITTGTLNLIDGGQINSDTFGEGDAGNIIVKAKEKVNISGFGSFASGLFSNNAIALATGDGGSIIIETGSLEVREGAVINASTEGQGNAGRIKINAVDSVTLDGEGTNPSSISSSVDSFAVGDAGGVEINTGSLVITNGGVISASSDGQGKAGDISITASESVEIIGSELENSVLTLFEQAIITRSIDPSEVQNAILTFTTGTEAAGNLTIDTKNLTLQNGAIISSSTFGEGSAGDLTLKTSENTELIRDLRFIKIPAFKLIHLTS
ncbi:MAG: hypothetical protein QNJ70_15385 [Xenococcaceae cyanobacterium MO_207.B15]|nr:hypothetical protein [Xenococcaceae cyanobacterium MO_207.B15]